MPTTRPSRYGNQAAQLRNNCGSKPDSQIRRSVHLSKRVGSQAVNFGYLMLVFWSDLTHRRRIHDLAGTVFFFSVQSAHGQRSPAAAHDLTGGRLVQRVLDRASCCADRRSSWCARAGLLRRDAVWFQRLHHLAGNALAPSGPENGPVPLPDSSTTLVFWCFTANGKSHANV